MYDWTTIPQGKVGQVLVENPKTHETYWAYFIYIGINKSNTFPNGTQESPYLTVQDALALITDRNERYVFKFLPEHKEEIHFDSSKDITEELKQCLSQLSKI